MSKTGERYSAARRQVVAKAVPPASEGESAANAEIAPAPDEPLHGPTSKTFTEWVHLLDESGARDKPHPEIVKWLTAEHDVPPWWRQDITVRYEKHIGRRVLGQRGSTFSATGSKTISVPAAIARAAWTDEARRTRWLPDVRLSQRPNKARIAARFDVNEADGRVMVSFDPRGDAKTTVAVEHEKLPDARSAKQWSAFWRERLSVLKSMLEQEG
jgi:hypothetical protein